MQAASGVAVAVDKERSALAAQIAKRRPAIRRQCDQLSEVSSLLLSALDQLSPLISIMSEPTYAVSAEPCPWTTTEGENKFRALLESAPAAMVIANQDGIIVLANIQTQKLFGYSREELQGQNVDILVPERFRGSHPSRHWGYFAEPGLQPVGDSAELFGLRKDGTEFPVETSLSPLKTDTGMLVTSAIRDITDRKRAEERFRDLLESWPDAIVITNNLAEIVVVNTQTEKMFGYARTELLGRPIETLIPQRDRDRNPEHHRPNYFREPHVRQNGTDIELFGVRKDGSEFPVEIRLSPLHTEEGMLVNSSIRDITERKRSQDALRDKNIELEKASKAKDNFLATMSHELRTPLNAILGFTGTLLMRLPGPLTGDQERQLQTVRNSARHLLSLINDLLDLAKIDSGEVTLRFVPINCQEVVSEIVETLRPLAAEKGLELSIEMPKDPITALTDHRALSQILINLTNNAIKFTQKGSVRLHLSASRCNDKRCVSIAVKDTGIGIKDEDRSSLFEAFKQLRSTPGRAAEGCGLGLHLSQRLASLLGGEISVQSQFGVGSTFTFALPG